MSDNHYSVEELIALSEKHGMSRIKVGPIELEFLPKPPPPEPILSADSERSAIKPPTPEEFVLWSAPDFNFPQSATDERSPAAKAADAAVNATP